MSTDWDVYCLDCKKEHGFSDANHREGEMADLCASGPKIKQIVLLLQQVPVIKQSLVPENLLDYQSLNFDFWIEHGDHRLWPISEYGNLSERCNQQICCLSCGCNYHRRCTLLPGHEGSHEYEP